MLETSKDYSATFGISEFTSTEFKEEFSFDYVRRLDKYRS